MNYSFDKWPFKKDESAILYWLRSPRMKGNHKQWMMEAVFKTNEGILKPVTMPWGALPALRLGMEFKNKRPVRINNVGKHFKIRFSENVSFNVEEAARSISPKAYPLKNRDNLQELCVVFFDNTNKITVVVPCLELLRFFFGFNKMLCHQILQPFDMPDIVLAEQDKDKVLLNFQQPVPSSIINPMLVEIIARILFDQSWTESWNHVYCARENKLESTYKNFEGVIPLEFLPPVFKNCSWDVRGIQDGKRILVLEIMGYRNDNPAPFKKIEYTRPKPIRRIVRKWKGKKIKTGGGIEGKINRTPVTHKKPYKPVLLKIDMPIHSHSNVLIIEDVTRGVRYITAGRGKPIEGPINPTNTGSTLVSLNDEGGKGEIQAAEFVPFDEDLEGPNGLKDFLLTIRLLKKLAPELAISVFFNKVPIQSPLAFCGSMRRDYVWAKIKNLNNQEISIIEFDLSDGHGISTPIIFSPVDQRLIYKLLVYYIVRPGNWDKQKFKRNKELKLIWAKHTSIDLVHWAEKFLRKIKVSA